MFRDPILCKEHREVSCIDYEEVSIGGVAYIVLPKQVDSHYTAWYYGKFIIKKNKEEE